MLIDHLDLVALQHRDIHELARFVAAAPLHHQQSRRNHLQHKAELRQAAARTPDEQISVTARHAQMNSGALHRGSQTRQRLRRQRNRPLEDDRQIHLRGRSERERNLWRIEFLPPETGPEGDVDDRFDGAGVGNKLAVFPQMRHIMRSHSHRRRSGCRICRLHPHRFSV